MEFKKKFVINAAFFAIILLIGVAAYKYLLPILTPFIIGLIIAMIVHVPLKRIPVKTVKAKRFKNVGFLQQRRSGIYFWNRAQIFKYTLRLDRLAYTYNQCNCGRNNTAGKKSKHFFNP